MLSKYSRRLLGKRRRWSHHSQRSSWWRKEERWTKFCNNVPKITNFYYFSYYFSSSQIVWIGNVEFNENSAKWNGCLPLHRYNRILVLAYNCIVLYNCIVFHVASNGVPPSVSKRYVFYRNFHAMKNNYSYPLL